LAKCHKRQNTEISKQENEQQNVGSTAPLLLGYVTTKVLIYLNVLVWKFCLIIALISLLTRSKGINICKAVKIFLAEKQIDENRKKWLLINHFFVYHTWCR